MRIGMMAAALVLVFPALSEPMKTADRERLISHLEMTSTWIADEVRALDPKQLAFRPKPEAWSVLDVLEHLNTAEPQYWKLLLDSMKQPALGKPGEVRDEAVLWYGIDRTQRNRTAEAREPKGTLKNVAEGVAELRKRRAGMLEYVRTTQDDLRMWRLEKSQMDVWQAFLMISAHSQRHILQIREIKAHPEFPR